MSITANPTVAVPFEMEFEECSACGGDYNLCSCMACDKCGGPFRHEDLVFGPDNQDDGETTLCRAHAIWFGLIDDEDDDWDENEDAFESCW